MSSQDTDPSTNPKNRNFQDSINTRPATADELAYRDGYVRGQVAKQRENAERRALESRIYEENARRQANEGASIGLVLGLTLAALAAIIGGLFYVYNDTNNPEPIAPTPEATTPEPTSETTIIERTIERTQEVVPTPSQITLPDVNVDVTPPPAAQPSATPEAAEPTNTAEPSATEPNTSEPEATGSDPATDAQTSGSEAQSQ